jgi:hypothetical protein
LRALAGILTATDCARARAAAARIEELGANRTKPLREELERWFSEP